MIAPSVYERPDRVRACPYPHRGPCAACGFDGHHVPRFEKLERRRVRMRCTCAATGPIRKRYGRVTEDWYRHAEKVA